VISLKRKLAMFANQKPRSAWLFLFSWHSVYSKRPFIK
jgi:hypothetical protein